MEEIFIETDLETALAVAAGLVALFGFGLGAFLLGCFMGDDAQGKK